MIKTIFVSEESCNLIGPIELEEEYAGACSFRTKKVTTGVTTRNEPIEEDVLVMHRQTGKTDTILRTHTFEVIGILLNQGVCDEVVIIGLEDVESFTAELTRQGVQLDEYPDEVHAFPNGGVLIVGDAPTAFSKLQGSDIIPIKEMSAIFACPKCEEPAYDPLEEEKRINRLKSMHNRKYRRTNKW